MAGAPALQPEQADQCLGVGDLAASGGGVEFMRSFSDAVYGIPPTVAIEQRLSRGGRKSTVGTTTTDDPAIASELAGTTGFTKTGLHASAVLQL